MDGAGFASFGRSAAMAQEGQIHGDPQELLMALCDEIVESRQHLERLAATSGR